MLSTSRIPWDWEFLDAFVEVSFGRVSMAFDLDARSPKPNYPLINDLFSRHHCVQSGAIIGLQSE